MGIFYRGYRGAVTIDASSRRYAKGDAKRREILSAALRVISERGYRHSSLQEIADAVGLSKAGVLHYFDSREELFAQVLSERDAADGAAYTTDDGDFIDLLREAIRHNQSVPGLVELYSRLVVETESLEHPGHSYVGERYKQIEATLAQTVRARQAAGTLDAAADPVQVARLLVAVSDGLQLQWLHDRSADMVAAFDAAVSLLSPRAAS